MNSCTERLKNGIITENPTFVMMLGMCPTLAVTSSAINGLGMGLTTTAVLILSNVFISLLRKVIPDKVRIPAFIVIVGNVRNVDPVTFAGVSSITEQSIGCIYPTYRSKLHYPRKSRGICIKESGTSICI